MRLNFKTVIIIFLVALIGAGLGTFGVMSFYGGSIFSHSSSENTSNNGIVINEVAYSDKSETSYTQAINKAYNTVVEVSTTVTSSGSTGYYFFFGQGGSSTYTSTGSGVIISEDGYIVTNNHVVEGANEDSVVVKLYDGSEHEARIIGTDSRSDIAVLKIDANGLQFSSFADSSDLVMGQDVIAIGNPLGTGLSCTNGIVSALEKEIYINNVYMTVIQTNAEVNGGNSGGGLFDINGNLIGIVNAKSGNSTSSTSVEGMGYAIPSNTVVRIVQEIIDNGYVKDRAALGVRVYTSSNSYYSTDGVTISEVIDGGSADQAGLEAGDIITAINGIEVNSYADLSKILDSKAVGDEVTVTVKRNDKPMDFKVVLQQSTAN